MVKGIVTDKKELSEICERAFYDDTEVINDLKDTAATLKNCAGLAAPQIGHKKRIIFVNVQKHAVIMVNPEIIETKGKNTFDNESCFSVPDTITRPCRIKRWFKVKVNYTNEDGDLIQQLFKGFEARLLQHEIDHLDGILIK